MHSLRPSSLARHVSSQYLVTKKNEMYILREYLMKDIPVQPLSKVTVILLHCTWYTRCLNHLLNNTLQNIFDCVSKSSKSDYDKDVG